MRTRAEALRNLIAPACDQVLAAGSIRRGAPQVHDIEIVAKPKMWRPQPDLFGGGEADTSLLDNLVAQLYKDHALIPRVANGRPAWGTKYKRAWYMVHGEHYPVDLFAVTTPAQWGVTLTLRTGPAAFSTRLVTKKSRGGLMPDWLHITQGALWHDLELIPTPEEADLFRELALPWLPPEARQ
jgi:DNA polymerase/3'-5' exonuclease PolX